VTFGSFVGVMLTLALVLGLLAVTMRLLRRVTRTVSTGKSGLKLEVLQRIALGPRQGIAIVRIGDQTVAVSVGEGGVRPIMELDDEPTAATAADPVVHAEAPRAPQDFRSLVRQGLRSAGLPLALALTTMVASVPVSAQATPPAAPATTQAAPRTVPAARDSSARRAATTATVPAAPQSSALDQALSRAVPQLDLKLRDDAQGGGLRLSGTVGVVILMGAMTLLPTLVLMMTGFTRILIVLHFLRQALGTQTAPPTQLIAGLALLLTGFVMAPTLSEMNRTAITPWLNGQMEQGAMMTAAIKPMREFMLRQTRERDIAAFLEMSRSEAPEKIEDVSTIVLTSAFVTSELRTAFQLGFVLFLPFVIIDLVVASVLMSMGMFMLPPVMISLPFKLLLFVLVDGWTLLVQSLVQGFR
jgi:flagellar biosynthesis protein FliP